MSKIYPLITLVIAVPLPLKNLKMTVNISTIPKSFAHFESTRNNRNITDFVSKELNVSEVSLPEGKIYDSFTKKNKTIKGKDDFYELDPLYFSKETDFDKIDENETVIKITKQNSFNKLAQSEIENINSQTIFLYDINEPTTSKGIRRTAMDVQCGPDSNGTITTGRMHSATTSVTKIPKLFSNGVKIDDSCINLSNQTSDMATSPETFSDLKSVTKIKDNGIRINDSCHDMIDHFIHKLETTDTFSKILNQNINYNQSNASKFETPLLEYVASDVKTNESVESSEFCSNFGSKIKSPSKGAMSSKYTSDIEIRSNTNTDISQCLSPTNQIKSKLCCGGVFVHSFRDREVSEDVLYQGGWQDIRPKIVARKNPKNNLTIRKKIEQPNSTLQKYLNESPTLRKGKAKENQNIKNSGLNNVPRRVVQIRNAKASHTKKDQHTRHLLKKSKLPPINKNIQNKMKNVTKVSSKIALSSTVNKNTFSSLSRPIDIATTKHEKDSKNIERYLPKYLKRKLLSLKEKTNDKEIKTSNTKLSVKTIAKLNHPNSFQKSITYQVFRNQVDKKKNVSGKSSPNTNESIKTSSLRSCSPNSQSSSCSSPNSIATVRAIQVRNEDNPGKLFAQNKDPVITNDSIVANIINDLKIPQHSSQHFNKENLSIAQQNCKLLSVPKKKGFTGKTSEVFRAQINDENKPLTSRVLSNSRSHASRNAVLNVSYNKITQNRINNKENSCDYDAESSPHSTIPVSDLNIVVTPRIEKNSTDNNLSLSPVWDNSKTLTCKTDIKELTKEYTTNNIAQPEPATIIKEILTGSRNIERQPSKDTISDNFAQSSTLISNEMILSNSKVIEPQETQKIDEMVIEPGEFGNIASEFQLAPVNSHVISEDISLQHLVGGGLSTLSKIDFNNISDESAIVLESSDGNHTASCNLSQSSFISANVHDNAPNVIDLTSNDFITNCAKDSHTTMLDSNSFQSVGTSKLSEYFLAGSHMNVANLESRSVIDLYDRKENHDTINVHGPISMQVFSGLSIDGAPVAGDQPDFVNLVDSETGSLCVDVARQTPSEELLVSGRSSDTYASCLVEDEVVVPSWLFNMLNQHVSSDGAETESDEPLVLPLVEPLFDLNGNADMAGAGAGAGDGRGIHSDQSIDSSGRGSSLSSSDTSTDPHGEVVLIGPSALLSHFEYAGDTDTANIDRPGESTDTSFDTAENDVGYNEHRVNSHGRIMTSDVDGDVSSLDTDVADSDA
ncbi:uncharacterized protein LOC126971830 isoform X2 [Leptidea sinapis]|uniref:uncharacterized protein LOC126971830 isoform X2 n=1 Tax=Leptidea sinapis TaxID=189913 RepID=UPI0021C2E733|nr:uncharacterized protein LOC126971830 isoform X2 [Leptidea sinapis]